MPPEERVVPRFAAEPPHELLPYGRWAERLTQEFLAACLRVEADGEDLGEPGEVVWYPDRSWHGRTFVPATTRTDAGYELYGYVSFLPATEEDEVGDVHAVADFTADVAEANPDWTIDLCDEVVGAWRGEEGAVAAMTLVWGRPLRDGGAVVTAELARLAVDQCPLAEGRFTLLAPDDYRGDTLEVAVFDRRGSQLARESLYAEDGEDGDAGDADGEDRGAGEREGAP
jgi:hypothetical protein